MVQGELYTYEKRHTYKVVFRNKALSRSQRMTHSSKFMLNKLERSISLVLSIYIVISILFLSTFRDNPHSTERKTTNWLSLEWNIRCISWKILFGRRYLVTILKKMFSVAHSCDHTRIMANITWVFFFIFITTRLTAIFLMPTEGWFRNRK